MTPGTHLSATQGGKGGGAGRLGQLGYRKLGRTQAINELGHGADLGRSKRLGGLKQKKRKKEGGIDLKF
jgi:hypothetical protein